MEKYEGEDLIIEPYHARGVFVGYTGGGFWRGLVDNVTGDDAEEIISAAREGRWPHAWAVLKSRGFMKI